ncbi:MAG: rhodanese-like domain-containing protein [Limnobacter sp.]|nr:rhodanese-like domain-containing protein [Limnobacter sp.]
MDILTATQLADRIKAKDNLPVILDVREPWELEICKLPGSLDIPMGEITSRLNEIDPESEIVCLCHHGVRSYQVALYLQRQGFDRVANLHGGIHAWAADVDTTCPVY